MGHGIFLLSAVVENDWIIKGDVEFWIFVIPLVAIGLSDYRASLLLSIVSTPLFYAPSVPHLFTQGVGDLFALTAVISFLIEHKRRAFRLLRGGGVVLLFIPIASLASIVFNFPGSDSFRWNQTKYEIAEFAGLSLAVAYSLLLASALRCERDFRIFIVAVLIAVAISVVHGLVSLGMASACLPDLAGTVMSSGGQVGGGFANPNYYASWLLILLPLFMYQLSNEQGGSFRRLAIAVALGGVLILLLLTVSRSALLALLFVLFSWAMMLKSGIGKLKMAAVILMLVTLFPAAWNFRFEACRENGDRSLFDYVYHNNSLAFLFATGDDFAHFLRGKTTTPLVENQDYPSREGVAENQDRPSRMELLKFAYGAWQSAPFFGVGPGNLSAIVHDRTGIGERAHNVAATVLAEQGAIGLLVWLLIWLAMLRRLFCSAWGGGPSPRRACSKYLFLAFLSVTITSLFADQYRVIWLWQFVGLALSPYFSDGDYKSAAFAGETQGKSVDE